MTQEDLLMIGIFLSNAIVLIGLTVALQRFLKLYRQKNHQPIPLTPFDNFVSATDEMTHKPLGFAKNLPRHITLPWRILLTHHSDPNVSHAAKQVLYSFMTLCLMNLGYFIAFLVLIFSGSLS